MNAAPHPPNQFPITEELPAVEVRGARSLGMLTKLLVAVLIAAALAVVAAVIVDNRRSDQAAIDSQTVQTNPDQEETTPAPDTTGAPTPVALDSVAAGFWQVTEVPGGLNVRAGPGVQNAIIGALNSGARQVFATGERATVNGSEWKQVVFGSNDTVGWVSAGFLLPDTEPSDDEFDDDEPALVNTAGSVVCFQRESAPRRIARIEFTNRTELSGILRTDRAQSTTYQEIDGTLSDGRAVVTLTITTTEQTTRQTWTFNPTTIDLGDATSMSVVNCDLVAAGLPR